MSDDANEGVMVHGACGIDISAGCVLGLKCQDVCQFTNLALSIMGMLKKHPVMFLQ